MKSIQEPAWMKISKLRQNKSALPYQLQKSLDNFFRHAEIDEFDRPMVFQCGNQFLGQSSSLQTVTACKSGEVELSECHIGEFFQERGNKYNEVRYDSVMKCLVEDEDCLNIVNEGDDRII
jgi:hypothetical protein